MDWLFLISRVIYPGVLKSQAPDAIIIAAGFKLRVFSFMSILRAFYERSMSLDISSRLAGR